MRTRFLLLAGVLTACAYTPPQPPFADGEVFLLRGTTATGEAISQTFTLRGGASQHDGRWQYAADGRVAGTAALLTDLTQELVAVVDASEALGARPDARVVACVVAPAGPGWRSADGVLVQGPPDAMLTLADRVDWSAGLPGVRAMAGDSGTCTLTRG